jgi:hypothetical protein
MPEPEEHPVEQDPLACRPWRGVTLARRYVRFPAGDLVGLAFLRGPTRGTGVSTGSRRWWEQGWRLAGPARGTVVVPAGNQLRVQVVGEASSYALWSLQVSGVDALSFAGAGAAASVLGFLPFLSDLKAIDLWSLPVGDDAIGDVWSCGSLQSVNLWGTRVSDAGLAGSVALPLLRRLAVPGRHTGDAALGILGGLPALRELDLAGSSVTDRGLAALCGARSLVGLSLWDTRITDDGLAHLGALGRLTHLDLGATSVTDSGLEALRGLPLRRLSLTDTLVTAEGLRALRSLLPGCQIEPRFPGAVPGAALG